MSIGHDTYFVPLSRSSSSSFSSASRMKKVYKADIRLFEGVCCFSFCLHHQNNKERALTVIEDQIANGISDVSYVQIRDPRPLRFILFHLISTKDMFFSALV